ncbi:DNA excision repair protein ERCC-6 [Phytophthora pseudosyringae]|uniref:DNA excision repair protein ERCC-6 n=1 Tax=Phytophthora pseudosyringae TaxID=221518 RepID=A0A8T1VFW5_9STRA|nr:DNA excision repair protein ERCC-6 [Phytophthora pseudosyringae]
MGHPQKTRSGTALWSTRVCMATAMAHGIVHPAGRWTLDGDFSELVFSTAYKGNIEVMAYLFERGATDKVRDALLHALREDHLDMVKWLIEHFLESERVPDYCVIDEAARYGRLEMLQYFERQEVSVVPGYFPSVTSPKQRQARNSSGDQMFVPPRTIT